MCAILYDIWQTTFLGVIPKCFSANPSLKSGLHNGRPGNGRQPIVNRATGLAISFPVATQWCRAEFEL